jgi:hypothetical protein
MISLRKAPLPGGPFQFKVPFSRPRVLMTKLAQRVLHFRLWRKPLRTLVFILIVAAALYYYFDQADPKPASSSYTSSSESEASPSTSSGDWGDGHQAGYDWAEQHSISDESACEEAGDHSNSPSFAEGCIAFVNGETH